MRFTCGLTNAHSRKTSFFTSKKRPRYVGRIIFLNLIEKDSGVEENRVFMLTISSKPFFFCSSSISSDTSPKFCKLLKLFRMDEGLN